MSGTDVADPARALLGLGGTVDREVAWSQPVLQSLVDEHAVTVGELSTDLPITSVRDLVVSIVAFLAAGIGGERHVASPQVVVDVAARFDGATTLGGTCVRAAAAMAAQGVPSTVHLVSIDDDVRRRMPDGVAWICSAEQDSTDPHLVVQFPAGATVRCGDVEVVAPRANRLIYVDDEPNALMRLDPRLGPAVARADVVLLSGLNSMRDRDALDDRLATLAQHLGGRRAGATAVFEDAGYHEPAFAGRVLSVLAPHLDVHSCNEDELRSHLGRDVDLGDADDVLSALDRMAAVADVPVRVVHTSRWALAAVRDPDEDVLGRHARALRRAVATASARYRHGDGADADAVAAAEGWAADPAAVALATALGARGDVVCVPAPALDDVASPTTIGLGDAFVGGYLAALVEGADVPRGATACG